LCICDRLDHRGQSPLHDQCFPADEAQWAGADEPTSCLPAGITPFPLLRPCCSPARPLLRTGGVATRLVPSPDLPCSCIVALRLVPGAVSRADINESSLHLIIMDLSLYSGHLLPVNCCGARRRGQGSVGEPAQPQRPGVSRG